MNKAARTNPGITPAQIKKLHALKTTLGMDDATYRAALSICGVTTSKALTYSGADELIEDFESKAVKSGVWKKHHCRAASEPRRVGFASRAQLALIDRLWDAISTAPEEGRKAALRKFVTRQAKVSDVRFLRDSDANKVIFALRSMYRKKFGEEFS